MLKNIQLYSREYHIEMVPPYSKTQYSQTKLQLRRVPPLKKKKKKTVKKNECYYGLTDWLPGSQA